jgi:hypothetical protein
LSAILYVVSTLTTDCHYFRNLGFSSPTTTRDTSMIIKLSCTNPEHYSSICTYVILPFTLSTFIFIGVKKL